MINIYGVLSNDVHIDISISEKAAKRYATINGFEILTIRYNGGYNAERIYKKAKNKWQKINNNTN